MSDRFQNLIREHHGADMHAEDLQVLQCNIIRRCNQACRHCHVESSPKRSEQMRWSTMARIIALCRASDWRQVDITGGAPELHPDFQRFISGLRATGTEVQVRSNLTVHLLPEMAGYLSFLAEQQVGVVASLPCYLEQNVDRQRGGGTFSGSIQVLQAMNRIGYGIEPHLPLHLVYNPLGMSLPPPQADLEQSYREQLRARYGIRFTGLYTITNMPIGRFAQDLEGQGQLQSYLDRLAEAFNPDTIDGLMCRHQIEVDWDGRVYDCDFNLALGLPNGSVHIHDIDPQQFRRRRIMTGEHCLGCTAGCGSSCGGALTDGERRRAAG